jgi:hypothetical protein
MPAMPPSRASVRSAAVINQEIRELAGRIGLWAEWQDAVAREAGLAA